MYINNQINYLVNIFLDMNTIYKIREEIIIIKQYVINLDEKYTKILAKMDVKLDYILYSIDFKRFKIASENRRYCIHIRCSNNQVSHIEEIEQLELKLSDSSLFNKVVR